MYSWGFSSHGQLGLGDYQRYNLPQLMQAFANVTAVSVACGLRHSLVLTNEGLVYSFGSNEYG